MRAESDARICSVTPPGTPIRAQGCHPLQLRPSVGHHLRLRCTPSCTISTILLHVVMAPASSQRTFDSTIATSPNTYWASDMTPKGKFLTLEGVDGAGKSTHLEWMAEYL